MGWTIGVLGFDSRQGLGIFLFITASRTALDPTQPPKWTPRNGGVLVEWRYSSTHSLTSALYEGEWSASRRGRFTPRERAPVTHWIGGWVGPRAGLNAVVKRKIPAPRQESNPKTPIFQPAAQLSYHGFFNHNKQAGFSCDSTSAG
jgi:hypothetical protein